MNDPILIQKLGSADAAWLRMETPVNPMTIVGLLVIEQPLGIDALKALLEERLLIFGRFKQKIRIGGSPVWVTDQDFDLDAHVHRVGLPPPGDKPTLEAYVGDLMTAPLDLSKPPWQMHLVEDYEGQEVLVVRLHHTIGDGIGLMHVLLSMADEYFVDFDVSRIPSYGSPVRDPSILETLVAPVGKTISSLGKMAGSVLGGTLGLVQRPGKVFDWAKTSMSVGAAASKIALLAADTPTRFKGEAGVIKKVAWSGPIPLEDIKRVCKSTGAKVNDVLLSSVAGGLRRYLEGQQEPVAEVEIGSAIPVNIRSLSRAFELGNQFGLVFLSLPIGIGDAGERLREIQRRMDQIKASAEPAVAFGILQAIGAGPKALHQTVVDILSSKCSAVVTNVPGPTEQIHFLGKPISHVMFWVPRAGEIGLGVSIISYRGTVRLGVATDARMVPDPQAIITGLHAEFDALKAAFDGKSAKAGRRKAAAG